MVEIIEYIENIYYFILVALAGMNCLCKPGWPPVLTEISAFGSPVLGLEMWATTLSFSVVFDTLA